MKRNILLACVLLLGLALFAEENYPKLPQLSEKQKREYFPLTAFQARNGKWGYKDREGKKTIIKPTFDITSSFEKRYDRSYGKNMAIVKYEGKYGLISLDMDYVLFPVYDRIVKEENNFFMFSMDSKWGLLDGSTRKFLLSCDYDEIKREDDVFIFQSNGKYGVIHKSGKVKLPCEQDEIQVQKDKYDYKNKLFLYKNQGKYGMLPINSESPLIEGVDSIWQLRKGIYCYSRDDKYGLAAQGEGFHREYPTIYTRENSPYVFAMIDSSKYDIFVLKNAAYTRIAKYVTLTNYPKNFEIPKEGAQLYDSLANKCYYLWGENLYSTLNYDKAYSKENSLPQTMKWQFYNQRRKNIAAAAEKKRRETEARTSNEPYASWKDMYEFKGRNEWYDDSYEYYEWKDGNNIYSDKILKKAVKSKNKYVTLVAVNAKTDIPYLSFFPENQSQPSIVIPEKEFSKTIYDGIDKSKVIPADEREHIEAITPTSVGYLPNGNILFVYTARVPLYSHAFYIPYHEYMGFCIIDFKTEKILTSRLTPLCIKYNYGPSYYRDEFLEVRMASSGGFYCFKKFESPSFYSSFYRYSENGDFEWEYVPIDHKVYVFLDYKKHLILGGSTDKKGYIGFENPAVCLVNANGIEKEVYYNQKDSKIRDMYIQNNQLYWGWSHGQLIPEMDLSNVTVPVTSAPGIPYEKFKMGTVTYAGKQFKGCGMIDDKGEWIIPPIFSFYANDPQFLAGIDNEYDGYIIKPYDETTKSATIICPDGKSFKKQLNPSGTGYINISE